MSDNNNVDVENEVFTDEEYEKAMELLNSSKSKRVKKINNSKKSEKKNKESGFIDKCKKDPVIPICFCLAIIAVVGALLYFIIPSASVKTMGYTVDEFKTKYEKSDIYANLLSPFDLAIPAVTYKDVTTEDSETTDKITKSSSNLKMFSGKMASSYNTYFQGYIRTSDNKIVYLNMLVPYTEGNVESGLIIYYFASYFEAVCNIDSTKAVEEASNAIKNFATTTDFTQYENIKYKVNLIKNGDVTYVSLEMMPV